jgi:hypothetical protein
VSPKENRVVSPKENRVVSPKENRVVSPTLWEEDSNGESRCETIWNILCPHDCTMLADNIKTKSKLK